MNSTEKQDTLTKYDEMYLGYSGVQGSGETAIIPDASVYSVGFGISCNTDAISVMSQIQNSISPDEWANNYIADFADSLNAIYANIANEITVGSVPPENLFSKAQISDTVTNHFSR